ncbi:cathepsin K-like [Aricia agestis]|uniref:cathepsin K-like n=1 Tax=Aricia agestis TaxID=91739 RepID=UPI001C201728|nr:cathepsin K-like [Aricia agestis]
MAVIALALVCFKLCTAFVLENIYAIDQQATLRLPTEYHFKGDDTNIDYEIVRPFEIWYSAKNNRSRKDTYGGTVKRYYYGDREVLFTIHPKSESDLVSQTSCTPMPIEGELENFLPSKKFVRSGNATYDNKQVDVWKYTKLFGQSLMQEAKLLVIRGSEYDIPVAYEEREVSLYNGEVNSHSITRYYDFQLPNETDLTYEKEKEICDWDYLESKEITTKLKYLHADVPSDIEEAFRRYKTHHSKEYDDEEEEELRALMFKKNWKLVTEHNSRNLSYRLGLNRFSDRLPSELVHLTATRPGSPAAAGTHPFPLTAQQLEEMADEIPDSYDLRMEGIISEIKSQGDCGSCWAFSTVAAVEGAVARSNGGRLLDLSEQSLVDCGWSEGNDGCDGSYLDKSFEYVHKYGIPTEKEYGVYLSEDGTCNYDNVSEVTSIKGYAKIPSMSPTAMKATLYLYGPVAGTINAMNDLKYYYSGVYNNPACNKGRLNHAITIVGYGDLDGTPYWIIKNSWGEEWGEGGYFLMAADDNNCHILEDAYYALV